MKIISEKTNKTYTNVEECLRDEAIFDKAQEEKTKKQKQLELAKKDRAKEVEKAYNDLIEAQKNYNNLRNNFIKDYKNYHMTYSQVIDDVNGIIDSLLKIN